MCQMNQSLQLIYLCDDKLNCSTWFKTTWFADCMSLLHCLTCLLNSCYFFCPYLEAGTAAFHEGLALLLLFFK
jgi:hypothetical protein